MTSPLETTSPPIEVGLCTHDQIPEAVSVITSGLLVEPGFTALLPDERQRRKVMTSLMTGIARISQSRNACYVALDQGAISGVAIWAPSGTYPFDLRTNLRMMPHILRLIGLGPRTISRLAEMDTNASKHFPAEPTWYLQALGVAPDKQGRGIGSAILRECLDRIDRDGQGAYLETCGEANVRLYRRHGFEVRDHAVHLVPADLGVTHCTMYRPPHTA
jgi:ribosomal protein S18 acetylase RimI-like enzyme